ncbi:MAG TPA: tetratricopeptide repeat protein, partial [Vicinamibacteria bacterium]|nr:tetratricopeptide repeat protein [Vicinamibacteria bacterium]
WLAVREIGGFVRATPDAVLNVERAKGAGGPTLVVGLNVTRPVSRGRLRVKDGTRVLVDEAFSLDPAGALQKRYAGLAGAPRYTVEALDDEGKPLVVYTEGVYDQVPAADVQVGAQVAPRVPAVESRTEDDWVAMGDAQEREGKLLRAYDTYAAGLARFGESFRLNKAAGRLAVALKRYDDATASLGRAEARVTNDADVEYALGLAWIGRGDGGRARSHFERALRDERTRPAAFLQLARLLAAAGDDEGALGRVRAALRLGPRSVRAGTFEVILLRRLGRLEEAQARLAYWRGEDPTLSILRNEAVKLGATDEALWRHLAGDPQRVLEAAVDYMDLGAWDDAVELLARSYPAGEGVVSEPGLPLPQHHPEVAYYRGYCREARGLSGRADFDVASTLPTTYVFPQRAWSLPVLQRAITVNPRDATAHFLLGSLYLSGGIADRAVREWQEARRLKPAIPGLHRNLGLTLLHGLGQVEGAREVFAEGIEKDPDNAEVYQGLDQVLGLLGRPASERVRALEAYPRQDPLPGALVFKRALALVEAGRIPEAEALFGGRFFAREEFGTNVRQVWVEVEVQKARALARGGDCASARSVTESIGREVSGLGFTQAGLEPFAEGARTHYLIGDVLAACGDAAGARVRWEKAAAASDAYPQANLAFAHRAAARLDRPDTVRPRVEAALEAWANRLVVGTNFPGANAAGQGLFLRELGREADAQAKLREALLLPDKVMSHYLSREALAEMGGHEAR